MWSLLHFSSAVQSKAAQPAQVFQKEFIPIINLFSLLYQDREVSGWGQEVGLGRIQQIMRV